jgi:hypothetical protein
MRLTISATLILLSALIGCGIFSNLGSNYGTIYPEGDLMATSCSSIRSFDPHLRSSPGLRGPDSFVGYIDYGIGMPRGSSYLILPGHYEPGSALVVTLSSFSPKESKLWNEAVLLAGNVAPGHQFEARVPERSREMGPRSKVVEREEILIVGRIQAACEKHYLVVVMKNPFGGSSTKRDWDNARGDFAAFLDSIIWPEQ